MLASTTNHDWPGPLHRAGLSRHSSQLEKILEHLLIGALGAELYRRGTNMAVLRDEVDGEGRDIMLIANGISRPIQFKSIVAGGARADITVNLQLAIQRSAGVIWYDYDPASLALGPFRWFGGLPGEHMPPPGTRVAKHSRGRSTGEKPERPGHRIIPRSRFERLDSIGVLADRLFGPTDGAHAERKRLLDHLICQPIRGDEPWIERVRLGRFSAIPERLDEDAAGRLATIIDGYQLLEGDQAQADQFLQQQVAQARSRGSWHGSATELWITLFLEHRRRRFADGFDGPDDDVDLFRLLERQLRAQLIALETV